MTKVYGDTDVLTAARERLRRVFKDFPKVYVSFSGGKDSGVMLNLALEAAREANRLPLDVLFIDLEAQYQVTIEYVEEALSSPDIRPWWVCLPLHLRNAVSSYQPHWLCWDPNARDRWVRELPLGRGIISDEGFFPFFRRGMEFEEFVPKFGEWIAGGERTCCLVGIRTDESLNRFRTIRSETKETWQGLPWTTQVSERADLFNAYPIYDWRTEDIWVANARFRWPYNRVYDLMHLAGVSIHEMRICQPYGDDQRRGLYLFHALEPVTWQKVVARVSGANFGKIYCGDELLGNRRVRLPDGHTWKSYAKLLLRSMPPVSEEHYRRKIHTFLSWWRKHRRDERHSGLGLGGRIPDAADPKLEAARKVPSWRRVAKVLLKNDYWCKGLSFTQTKREMERQLATIERYMKL